MELTLEENMELIDRHAETVAIVHDKKERKFPVHSHAKGQLTYVEGGMAYVHLTDRTYVIPAGHYIWMPGGVVHRLQIRHAATAVRNLYFYNHDDAVDPFYNKMGIYPITRLLHEMIVFTNDYPHEVWPGSVEYQFLAALKTILPTVSKITLPFIVPTTQHEKLRPVIDYITKNIDKPLTLAQLSSEFNMSQRSFSRLFQAELSISFLQYLKQRRIIRGIEMMLHTRANLTQIAYETGYQSLSAFSATFQQVMNMRPSEFMAQL